MAGKIHIILLAAGQSRRFGGNKLLHRLRASEASKEMQEGMPDNGKELYKYLPDTIESLPGDLFGTKCIVSQYPEIMEEMKVRNYQCVMNEMPDNGISHSIFLGISRLEELGAVSEEDAVMFGVCDQPFLKAETLLGLLEMYQKSGRGIGCVRFQERSGNPVIFSAKYLAELKELQGDRGGKQVLKRHPEDVAYYEVEDEAELRDIDTREMLGMAADSAGKQAAKEKGNILTVTGLSEKEHAVIAIVGAGGKTTLAYRLAHELLMAGKRVLVTTTTHMMKPEEHFIEWNEGKTAEENIEQIKDCLENQILRVNVIQSGEEKLHVLMYGRSEQAYTVGIRTQDAKIKGIPEEHFHLLAETVDFLIVEADGSKRLPFKVPAAHEPVIPKETDYVIGVIGFPAAGKPIAEVSHRPEEVAGFLEKSVTDRVEFADIRKVMLSPEGLLKGVHVPYTLILNRCPKEWDSEEKELFAEKQIVFCDEMEMLTQEMTLYKI